MIAITHAKISSLTPNWAPFPGCSVIFTTFGASPDPATRALRDGAHRLHAGLRAAFEQTDIEEWKKIGFCPVPLDSYHLTIADLVNPGDLRRVVPEWRNEFLRADGKLKEPREMARLLETSLANSLTIDVRDLRFELSHITNRYRRVVVAELTPEGNSASLQAFERLCDARAKLSQAMFGEVRPYEPHVTIGYFANRELAAQSDALVAALNDKVEPIKREHGFGYGIPALFEFDDMATFRRL